MRPSTIPHFVLAKTKPITKASQRCFRHVKSVKDVQKIQMNNGGETLEVRGGRTLVRNTLNSTRIRACGTHRVYSKRMSKSMTSNLLVGDGAMHKTLALPYPSRRLPEL